MTITHRASLGIAVALALGATAAPAYARPFNINSQGSLAPVGMPAAPATHQAATSSHAVSPPPATVRVIARDGGFDWGDAGIGAAGAVTLGLVGVGGAFAVSQHQRARRATA